MSNYVLGGGLQRSPLETAGDYTLSGLGAADGSILTRFAQVEAQLSNALRPVYPALDALPTPPYLDAGWHERLKRTPLTALIQVFQPVENLAIEIIDRTNQITNRAVRTIGIPGVNAVTTSMSVYQPGDDGMDVATRDLVHRLREICFFMTLVQQSSPSLALAMGQVLAKYGLQGGAAIANFLRQHGVTLPPAPQLPPPVSLPPLPNPGSWTPPSLPDVSNLPPLPSLPHLGGLGVAPVIAAIGEKAAAAFDTMWKAGLAAAAIIVPPVLVGVLLGGVKGVTSMTTQQVPPQGTPGPKGETDGTWVPGPQGQGPVWQPGTFSQATGALSSKFGPYAVPAAIGLGLLLLLRR